MMKRSNRVIILFIFIFGFTFLYFYSSSYPPVVVPFSSLDFSSRPDVQNALSFNRNFTLRNADLYGPHPPSAVPFLLLVHRKPHALRRTLESLSRVEGINETTLIVSHDGLDPQVWDAVQSLRFMRVRQLVHPYSPWLPSNALLFPGDDPVFSMRDADGAFYGHDQFGSPRSPKHTALKHHWWWALHRAFDPATLGSAPPAVAYLEDDWAFTRDYYRALQSAVRFSAAQCPRCITLNMGAHRRPGKPLRDDGVARADELRYNAADNLGLVVLRRGWDEALRQEALFCEWEDYNWDWTIKYVISRQRWGPRMLTTAANRVQHAGQCGLHAKEAEKKHKHGQDDPRCGSEDQRAAFSKLPFTVLAEDPQRSVPANDKWRITGFPTLPPLPRAYGGWSAKEDIEHCKKISQGIL